MYDGYFATIMEGLDLGNDNLMTLV
jgi:hypothetical protein